MWLIAYRVSAEDHRKRYAICDQRAFFACSGKVRAAVDVDVGTGHVRVGTRADKGDHRPDLCGIAGTRQVCRVAVVLGDPAGGYTHAPQVGGTLKHTAYLVEHVLLMPLRGDGTAAVRA